MEKPKIEPCNGKQIKLLVLVISRRELLQRRMGIRYSWGKDASKNMLIRYVIGGPTEGEEDSEKLDKILNKEQEQFGDLILYFNLAEGYDQLQFKIGVAFQWQQKWCSNAEFVMKIDDDSLIDLPRWDFWIEKKFKKQLKEVKNGMAFFGHLFNDNSPIRAEDNKWYVSEKEFPNKVYPNHMHGSGYFATGKAITSIMKHTKEAYAIHIEDALWSGILAEKGNVTRVNHGHDHFLDATVILLKNKLINGALDVDNEIIGTPQINCEKDFVHFKVKTKKTFIGRVYVKGEFDNPKCLKRSTLKEEKNGSRIKEEISVKDKATEDELEDDYNEETIHQILKELQKRKQQNLNSAQIPIPSHFPSASSAERLKRWRSFLTGKPGLDGQLFRRYGSKLSPDFNGECPLVCPPCENEKQKIEEITNSQKLVLLKKRRSLLKEDDDLIIKNYAELYVPIGECNTRRDRILIIKYLIYIFIFFYITRVDCAYNIQCAYQEPERTLSAQIDVSPPPVIPINNQMQPPQCSYKIHGQKTNEQVQNVQVGEPLEHEWICQRNGVENIEREQQQLNDLYGLLVHDCFVDDGKNRRALVLDRRGYVLFKGFTVQVL
uniref:ZP domain-containing protein n=1 Tax=Meloidogyne hapla TaxID=6305 RepID=A0A1I8B6Z0_MELHA